MPKHFAGFFKGLLDEGILFAHRLEHANGLGTLTGKNKRELTHDVLALTN